MQPASAKRLTQTGARCALLATLLVALPLSACKKTAEETPEVSVSVQAEHPVVGPISAEIAADAILAPLGQAALSPRISSPIRAEYVQRGAHVHRGQLLLTLEDKDLQGSALDSQGSLTSAQAAYTTATDATIPEEVQKAELDVKEAKANLDVALRTYNERQRLFKEGALSGRDADSAYAASVQAQATFDAASTRLASVLKTTRDASRAAAQGQLASAKGRLLSAEAQVSYARLRSPIDGVVTDRPLFPGETATAGTTVLTVMDTSSLLAKLHLSQASAQQLRVGGAAEIQVAGMDAPIPATISLISPALDPGSTTVEIWLKLGNPDGRFKVGTPVHSVIRGRTVAHALQIPASAVLPTQDGGTEVMLLGADGLAHKRAVRTGIRTADKVEIIGGLSAGDMVITSGSYGLDDGTRVTAASQKPDSASPDEDKN